MKFSAKTTRRPTTGRTSATANNLQPAITVKAQTVSSSSTSSNTKKANASAISSDVSGGLALPTFTIDRNNPFVNKGIIPEGMLGWFEELNTEMGFNIFDNKNFNEANAIAAQQYKHQLDEKLICMASVKEAAMKYLKFQVSEAKVQTAIAMEAIKAGKKIGQAKLKVHTAYLGYLRKMAELDKVAANKREIAERQVLTTVAVLDDRKGALIQGLEHRRQLGASTTQIMQETSNARDDIGAQNKIRLDALKTRIKVQGSPQVQEATT